MKEIHIFYIGRVQGVGFRYFIIQTANRLDLTGWVKNLNDGRVEVIAQGPGESLQFLVSSIDEKFSRYITEKNIKFHDLQFPIKGFVVKH